MSSLSVNLFTCRHGMLHLLECIFHNLSSADLRAVRLVSSTWFGLVEQLIQHGELSYLSHRWRQGEPRVERMQVSSRKGESTKIHDNCSKI